MSGKYTEGIDGLPLPDGMKLHIVGPVSREAVEAARAAREAADSRDPAHEILPRPGTAVQEGVDAPADLLVPADYPVLAICQCGLMIRCEHWLRGNWEHVAAS